MIRVLRIREGRGERNEGIIKEGKGKLVVLRISAGKRSAIVLLISLGDQTICNCPVLLYNVFLYVEFSSRLLEVLVREVLILRT